MPAAQGVPGSATWSAFGRRQGALIRLGQIEQGPEPRLVETNDDLLPNEGNRRRHKVSLQQLLASGGVLEDVLLLELDVVFAKELLRYFAEVSAGLGEDNGLHGDILTEQRDWRRPLR
jgi:hypothetical protein